MQTEKGAGDASGSTLDVKTEGRMGGEWMWSKGSEAGEAFGGGEQERACMLIWR